jgi:hypothetical protein
MSSQARLLQGMFVDDYDSMGSQGENSEDPHHSD